MKRKEIIEKLHNLHECSYKIMQYGKVLDMVPEKKKDVSKWLQDEKKQAEYYMNALDHEIQVDYYNLMIGKCFVRLSVNDLSSLKTKTTIMLCKVKDTYKRNKGIEFTYDVCYNILCEYILLEFDENNEIIKYSYEKMTDQFYPKCGYLDSNSVYGITYENLNGWKELDPFIYEKFVKQYKCDGFNFEINPTNIMEFTQNFDINESE